MSSRSRRLKGKTQERLIAKMHCLQQPCTIKGTLSAVAVEESQSVSDILLAALSKNTLSDCLSNRLTCEATKSRNGSARKSVKHGARDSQLDYRKSVMQCCRRLKIRVTGRESE